MGERGLLGGSGAVYIEKGLQRPHFETPRFLDPLMCPPDVAALRTFLDHDHLEIEIGCGRGHFIEEMARTHGDRRFLVIEARGRYVAMALRRLDRLGADNARVVFGDARESLEALVPEGGAHALYLLFPDPWWKRKHEKKRVATPAFLATVCSRLRAGGFFVFRSDVEAYVARMDGLMAEVKGFERLAEIPEGVARSHRHKKCLELGTPIWERGYRRVTVAESGTDREGGEG